MISYKTLRDHLNRLDEKQLEKLVVVHNSDTNETHIATKIGNVEEKSPLVQVGQTAIIFDW